MKITLVRHGLTEYNCQGRIQGRSNFFLNDKGRKQCQKLRKTTDKKEYDICFSSPFIRAFETAMILVGDRAEIKKDERLKERYMGELEGKMHQDYDFHKYWDYKLNSNEQGIEPIKDIFKRCNSFIDYIKEKYPDKSILIVSHGAPVRAMHHILKNTNLEHDKLLDIDMPNCYYEEIEINAK